MAQITVADGLDCAWLKRCNYSLNTLPRTDRLKILPGQKLYPVEVRQHDPVTSLLIFNPPLFAALMIEGVALKIQFDSVYAHTPHLKITIDNSTATTAFGAPAVRRLKVPYRSQRDNLYNPSGSCNVTSLAMCLLYHGLSGDSDGQLEDELYEAMDLQGLSRHNPYHLKVIAEQYGAQDDFVSNAQIDQVKQAIDSGVPVIAHGYLTSFGHVIVIIGYNETGFIVHDPYGEWHDFGYDLNDEKNQNKGEGLTYSYGLFRRLFMPDGGAWCHFLDTKLQKPPSIDRY
jgi:uncharacterized protein YvpB